MAIDTAQKRMSALDLGSPWRGPLVDATEVGFTQGNRQAADLLYSGLLASAPVVVVSGGWSVSTDEPILGTHVGPIVFGDLGG